MFAVSIEDNSAKLASIFRSDSFHHDSEFSILHVQINEIFVLINKLQNKHGILSLTTNFGSSLAQSHVHFSPRCVFMMGLG